MPTRIRTGLQSGGNTALVVRRECALDADGGPASRSGRVLNAAGRSPKSHHSIADELIYCAALPLSGDEREMLIDEVGHLGSGHFFGRRCEADDIG